jgi:deoxyribonuclease V
VLSYPSLELAEVQVETAELPFPYIPGLLSFREAPLIIRLFARLRHQPDLLLVDGHGIAHPRRLGIAAHLGLWLDIPTVGCAKSRLYGTHAELKMESGSSEWLYDASEIIGAVLRTRRGSNPLYVSIGHNISLENALQWVLLCTRGYRLPEPTRLAHLAAGGKLPA